jgi:hypothetical protein
MTVLLALNMLLNPLGMWLLLLLLVSTIFLFLVKKGLTIVLCSHLSSKARGIFSGLKKLLEIVLVIAVRPREELLGRLAV